MGDFSCSRIRGGDLLFGADNFFLQRHGETGGGMLEVGEASGLFVEFSLFVTRVLAQQLQHPIQLIGGFFLLREHWSHIAGYWPYLLLLACPLLHLFHGHGGHGSHGGGSGRD